MGQGSWERETVEESDPTRGSKGRRDRGFDIKSGDSSRGLGGNMKELWKGPVRGLRWTESVFDTY